jgi:tetratricopeptide (TPR) repeat protein
MICVRKWKFPLLGVFLAGALTAQESGPALLGAAKKRMEAAARATPAETKTAIEEALAILRRVPAAAADDAVSTARAHLEMGRLHRRAGRDHEAEEAWNQVLATTGADERTVCDALADLASLHRRTGRLDRAEACLRRIVDQHPKQAGPRSMALIRLASTLRERKQDAEAMATLRRVLGEHGDRWRACIDALDDLVAMTLKAEGAPAARKLLDEHTQAIRARFAGSPSVERVEKALAKMSAVARLEGRPDPAPRPEEPEEEER